MFNIGGKIKTLARIIAFVGAGASIIGGTAIGTIIVNSEQATLIASLIAVGGVLISLVSSFVIYGLGQAVENSDIIVQLLQKDREGCNDEYGIKMQEPFTVTSKNTDDKYIDMLNKGCFCKKCGAILTDNQQTCHVCGEKISNF